MDHDEPAAPQEQPLGGLLELAATAEVIPGPRPDEVEKEQDEP